MTKFIMAIGLLSTLAGPVFAANATHPYQNCDRRVDSCGPTGDETTDQLNGQQLGQPTTMPAPGPDAGSPQPMPPR